jgi:hypothetical protein
MRVLWVLAPGVKRAIKNLAKKISISVLKLNPVSSKLHTLYNLFFYRFL